MCQFVINGCSRAGSALWNTGATVAQIPQTLCRKFEDLTNTYLPKGVASSVQKSVYGLPIAVASFQFGMLAVAPIVTAVAIANIVFDKNPLNNYGHQVILRGLGNTMIVHAITNLVVYLKTASVPLATIAIDLLAADLLYRAGRLFIEDKKVATA